MGPETGDPCNGFKHAFTPTTKIAPHCNTAATTMTMIMMMMTTTTTNTTTYYYYYYFMAKS